MPTGDNAVHVERPDESGSLRSAPDYLARPKAAPISSGAAVKLSRSKLAPYRSRGSDDQIPELLCVTRKKVGEARRPAFGTANSHAASWALTSQKPPPPDRLTCLLLLTPRSEDSAQPCQRECTPYSPKPCTVGDLTVCPHMHRTTAAPSASPTSNMKSSHELDFNIVCSKTFTRARTTLLTQPICSTDTTRVSSPALFSSSALDSRPSSRPGESTALASGGLLFSSSAA